jgi:hypothetical protein
MKREHSTRAENLKHPKPKNNDNKPKKRKKAANVAWGHE